MLFVQIINWFTFTEPVTFELDATDLDTVQLQANISWSPQNLSTSLDANQTFTLTVTSTNTELRTIRIANERHYVFEAQEDAPPCEVYNFSVTATPVGATYTGDGCSVPSPVLSRMLPSLPDITPLKQSQNYSLQSLQSGEIELTVYFQVPLAVYPWEIHTHSVFSPGFSEGIGALAGLPAIGGGWGGGCAPSRRRRKFLGILTVNAPNILS